MLLKILKDPHPVPSCNNISQTKIKVVNFTLIGFTTKIKIALF